jgi:predicted ATPase/predicted Ser/Thr protein kinase
MGQVFRAYDPRLGRDVALKVIAEAARHSDARARFEQEARAASAINHANIVTIYDIGDDDGRPFIVMELLEGHSLRQLLSQQFSIDLLLRIATQIADALSAAHARGIVHRDLKPENIFVTSQGSVKVLDFGLARICEPNGDPTSALVTTERLTKEGLFVGTIGYAAPEALSGKSVDTRADVFSFGAILYEMICGVPAFHGKTASETLAATLRDDPQPIAARRPNASQRLARLITQCLEKTPERRFTSMRELHDELRALLAVGSEPAMSRRRHKPLPAPRTPMIGREAELARIKALVVDEGVRLLTLTGPGGGGKTRLALATADALLPHFHNEVFFVPLGIIKDPTHVCISIAQALGVSIGAGESPPAAVIAEVNTTAALTLLVLDNFEQVMQAANEISELLAACPVLSIIVTSREVLRLYGEYDIPIPPLPVPDSESDLAPEELARTPAVALFIARARAVDPTFRLTDDAAGPVVEICRALDGLPLALELAAARIRTLPPRALLARLGQRLDVLTAGARDLPDRQHTMRRAIDWSHDLLTPEEQTFFRRLSVFVGGFTLEGAEAVCDPHHSLGTDAVDSVASLVDKSLVQKEEVDGGARFEMLETIREYATNRLDASEDSQFAKRAHAAYFLILAEEGAGVLGKQDSAEWLALFAREHENFRAALDSLLKNGQAQWGLRMSLALFHYWERAEHLTEGRRWLSAFLELPLEKQDDNLRARALFASGVLAATQSDYSEAVMRTEMSLALHRRAGDSSGMAVAHNALGIQFTEMGDFDRAARHLEESLLAWREVGNDGGYARSLSNLGFVRRKQRRFDEAHGLYDEAEGIFKKTGDRVSSAWSLNHKGGIARDEELWDEARNFHQNALTLFRSLGDIWGIASTVADLGTIARKQEDTAAAEELYREALESFVQLGHRRGIARILESMAVLAAQRGSPERALVLATAATKLREKLGVVNPFTDKAELMMALDTARRATEPHTADGAQRRGALMSLPEAIRFAQSR